jgi:toxin ParE1/3/4
MARVELAPDVLDDFDRFFDHLTRFEVEDAQARIAEIVQAIQILTVSPLIGRPVKTADENS